MNAKRLVMALVGFAAGLCASDAAAEPVHIHVRGAAVIQAVSTPEPDGFVVRGQVDDDAGTPIARAQLAFPATGSSAIPVAELRTCGGAGTTRGKTQAVVTVESDDRGAFCVSGKTSSQTGSFVIQFAGDKLHEAATLELTVEAAREHVAQAILRFEAVPEVMDLDRESMAVTASLRVDRADALRGPVQAKREGLPLVLFDERGTKLAEATTGGDGRARFEVKSAALGPPGAGDLIVRFAGSIALSKAEAKQAILRRAEVRLELTKPVDPADPEEGTTIEVAVASSRGPVDLGVIEALRGNDSVGAGSVAAGKARVTVTLPRTRDASVPLRLRYVPASPWFRPGPELKVDVRFAGPSVYRQLGLAVVVLGFAAWVVAGWRRAPKPPVVAGKDAALPAPSGKAGVHVLQAEPGGTGWRGTVTDAHEGTPIAGASLRIVAPTFQGDGVVATALTDASGAFRVEASHRSDARLVVESDLHSPYEQALPPPSVLGIALVTRRRALLDRLVRWARRRGAPYDIVPEPTPGHVRRAATRAEAAEVGAWATRVEDAVYGPGTVGAATDAAIRSVEPGSS